MLCFAVGAAAMFGSVLSDDLVGFYQLRHLLDTEREYSAKLESLIEDYHALLQQLKNDPNLINRLSRTKLGTDIGKDPNTVYPDVKAEQLDAARRALTENSENKTPEPDMPVWLKRCTQPGRRTVLFLAGGILILISLVCFRPVKSIKIKSRYNQKDYESNKN